MPPALARVVRQLPCWWPGFAETLLLPLLRGCGQMLFQSSARTGGAFLLLIASQSPAALTLCLAGALGSTLCAYKLEHPDEAYFEGLGGFNGGLLGLALGVFYEFSVVLLLIALAGGTATGLVRAALFRLLPVPSFTAPFVLVAWLAFLAARVLALPTSALPLADPWPVYALTTNASQVLFMLHPWIGALVIVAVWLHSRDAALWVVAASLIAWLTALVFQLPAELAAAGLLGYNALILAAALQHRGTPAPLAAAGVVGTVGLTYLFFAVDVAPLSAPFVLSAWLVIAVEYVAARRPLTPG